MAEEVIAFVLELAADIAEAVWGAKKRKKRPEEAGRKKMRK